CGFPQGSRAQPGIDDRPQLPLVATRQEGSQCGEYIAGQRMTRWRFLGQRLNCGAVLDPVAGCFPVTPGQDGTGDEVTGEGVVAGNHEVRARRFAGHAEQRALLLESPHDAAVPRAMILDQLTEFAEVDAPTAALPQGDADPF